MKGQTRFPRNLERNMYQKSSHIIRYRHIPKSVQSLYDSFNVVLFQYVTRSAKNGLWTVDHLPLSCPRLIRFVASASMPSTLAMIFTTISDIVGDDGILPV